MISSLLPPRVENNLDNNIIEELLSGLISTTLIDLEIKDFNISINEKTILKNIKENKNFHDENGKFERGLSRGDGKEGEDITANLDTINDIPKKILDKDFPKEIDIRGEVFIKNSDFESLKEKFANPRNAASGSLRQKNPEDTKRS